MPTGEIGEVSIKGANVTKGYKANPEANKVAFTSGWFHTGDRGKLDSEGYLSLTGRIKELINRGGAPLVPRVPGLFPFSSEKKFEEVEEERLEGRYYDCLRCRAYPTFRSALYLTDLIQRIGDRTFGFVHCHGLTRRRVRPGMSGEYRPRVCNPSSGQLIDASVIYRRREDFPH